MIYSVPRRQNLRRFGFRLRFDLSNSLPFDPKTLVRSDQLSIFRPENVVKSGQLFRTPPENVVKSGQLSAFSR